MSKYILQVDHEYVSDGWGSTTTETTTFEFRTRKEALEKAPLTKRARAKLEKNGTVTCGSCFDQRTYTIERQKPTVESLQRQIRELKATIRSLTRK